MYSMQKALADMCYFIPCPKSPHGCDVDPNGEYIVGSGKLAALIPVFSFAKLQTAIAAKDFEGNYDGIPVVKYESALYGEVKKPLRSLHTEFDGKGNAYTSFFVSSEVVKWNERLESARPRSNLLLYRPPLCSRWRQQKPSAKYVIAYNKITKDRYLPTGPELTKVHSYSTLAAIKCN